MDKTGLYLLLLASASTFLLVFLLTDKSVSITDFNLFDKSVLSNKKHELEKDRQLEESCKKDFPYFLDVLVLGLSAGLSFDASLDLYCEKFDTYLAFELRKAQTSWQVGLSSRYEALSKLALDMDMEELGRFATCVKESLEFGTPLATTLERQAVLIRDKQRIEIEEEIEKVSIRMLIPLGVLIVPAMLIAIMGPLLSGALNVGL